MLTAAGVLVVMLATVLVRMGTQRVLVEKGKIDNKYTQIVLTGTTSGLIPEDRGGKDKKIDWQKQYPFADIETATKSSDKPKGENGAQNANNTGEKTSWLIQKAKKLAAWPLNKVKRLANLSKSKAKAANNIFQREKSAVSSWSGRNLLGYNAMVEVGRGYEVELEWQLMNPQRRAVELEDGVWSGISGKGDSGEKIQAVSELGQWLKQKGINFCYIVAPFKVNKYGDFEVNGRLDFSNQNADNLIAGLRTNGIETLDLRENLHEWCKKEGMNYHEFFYRTDHHWKPETALRAAKVVGERLKAYGIPVEDSRYDLKSFHEEVLPEFFLGSYGKKVTLAKAKADDFVILRPKFPTQIHFELPQREIDITGSLDKVAYDYFCIAGKDYYRKNPYAMYGYGDKAVIKMENVLLPSTEKKVLLVKDSFSDTMGPLLATGVRNITMVDLRHFQGSLRSYIEELHPDVVLVMYHAGNSAGSINWKSHKDTFDFR